MLASGFLFLAEGPGRREVVGGEVGQMWKPLGGSAPAIRDARQFVAFEEPGYAKVAMNFFVEPADGGTRLTTETRVMTTDAVSRRRFALYWRVIYPGSALIRRSWLRAARRRAEGPPG
jgi:hypothetical protein